MYTIGDVVKEINLSRSTILYYEKIGLLKSSIRNDSNYRIYYEDDIIKLKKIIMYKELGISLKEIKELINFKTTRISEILETRVKEINDDIVRLKKQEKLVLEYLRKEVIIGRTKDFSSKTWTEMLINLGYKEKDWMEWHREFEKKSPDDHYKFLKNLNMSEEDIGKLILKLK